MYALGGLTCRLNVFKVSPSLQRMRLASPAVQEVSEAEEGCKTAVRTSARSKDPRTEFKSVDTATPTPTRDAHNAEHAKTEMQSTAYTTEGNKQNVPHEIRTLVNILAEVSVRTITVWQTNQGVRSGSTRMHRYRSPKPLCGDHLACSAHSVDTTASSLNHTSYPRVPSAMYQHTW